MILLLSSYALSLRYNTYEFVRQAAIDEATFIDNVEELVVEGKDPSFPRLALYTLNQIDRGELASFSCFHALISWRKTALES